MRLTLPYLTTRYNSPIMEAVSRLVVLFLALLMAFSPVAVQASACLHAEAVSVAASGDVDASHDASFAKAEHSIPTNDTNAPHCTTCCLAHSVVAPLNDAAANGEAVSVAVRIGLPRDWAGIRDHAPDGLLRPPRP